MPGARGMHRARRAPDPGRRVVQLGAFGREAASARGDVGAPACDQHLAVRQQRCRVVGAAHLHRARQRPRGLILEQGGLRTGRRLRVDADRHDEPGRCERQSGCLAKSSVHRFVAPWLPS